MPWFDFTCASCGQPGRERRSRQQGAPKTHGGECRSRHMAGRVLQGERHVVTPEASEIIRRVYQTGTGNGEVNALAARLGLPKWKIVRHAQQQGWQPVTHKAPAWTAPELALLEKFAYLGTKQIKERLRRAGFKRSETGILLKRKHLRLAANLGGQSAFGLAACLGVDGKTVTRWIEQGLLKAWRRGTARVVQGDTFFIKDRWVRDFILKYPERIDLRKVDKFWFIDLLTGTKDGRGWGAATLTQSEGRKTALHTEQY